MVFPVPNHLMRQQREIQSDLRAIIDELQRTPDEKLATHRGPRFVPGRIPDGQTEIPEKLLLAQYHLRLGRGDCRERRYRCMMPAHRKQNT